MNGYCKHKIGQFHAAFAARTFDQDDVALLIVLARDYARPRGLLRELGDFLAHPEAKDRGLVLDFAKQHAAWFDANVARLHEPGFVAPRLMGLKALPGLIADLQAIFEKAGLPRVAIDEDDNIFRDFVFCVVFLLSSCRLKIDGRLHDITADYAHGLELRVVYVSQRIIPRHRMLLPVITLRNVNVRFSGLFAHPFDPLRDHVVRRLREGCLAAIPYRLDRAREGRSLADFDGHRVWPLPDYHRPHGDFVTAP